MNAAWPVLVYQKIGRPAAHSRLQKEWTSPRRLEKMLAFLSKRSYTFIMPKDLQNPLPAKPVLLAFMGGYQSFYTDVFPLLTKYQACATVFVAVEALGAYNSWQNPHEEPWQNVLTVKQLQEMLKSKRVQIGTLGLDGHNLLDDEPGQARAALQESAYRLKTLHKIDTCAVGFWPFAQWNPARAQHAVHDLNLPIITSQKGTNSPDEKQFLRVVRPTFLTRLLLK